MDTFRTPFSYLNALGLIIYSYFHGVRSSRQIETKCRYDVGFRIVTRNSLPDHSTILRFIKKNSSFIGQLFIPVLTLLNEAGLINNTLLALDGAKMKANASLGSNMPYEKIEGEIKKYLNEVQEKDEVEDQLYEGICSIPLLASIGDWCTRNLMEDDNISTPASIVKGIMEVTLTPYGAKKIYAQKNDC